MPFLNMKIMEGDRFTSKVGEMSAEFSQCKDCVYFEGDRKCVAYNNIPFHILVNDSVCPKREPKNNKEY